MTDPETTDRCLECGKPIPLTLVFDPVDKEEVVGLCSKCRYGKAPAKLPTVGNLQLTDALPDGHVDFVYPDEPDAGRDPADEHRDDLLTGLAAFLGMMTAKDGRSVSAKTAGHRMHALRFRMGKSEFRTEAELADFLNISRGRMSQIFSEIPSDLASVLRLNRRSAKPRR
jgi:hypothetical protein